MQSKNDPKPVKPLRISLPRGVAVNAKAADSLEAIIAAKGADFALSGVAAPAVAPVESPQPAAAQRDPAQPAASQTDVVQAGSAQVKAAQRDSRRAAPARPTPAQAMASGAGRRTDQRLQAYVTEPILVEVQALAVEDNRSISWMAGLLIAEALQARANAKAKK